MLPIGHEFARRLLAQRAVWRHGQPASRTWIVDINQISDEFALRLGITPRPLRVTSEPSRPIRYRTFTVEVVGDQVFGDAPVSLRQNARRLAAALEIGWGVFVFYSRKRTSFN